MNTLARLTLISIAALGAACTTVAAPVHASAGVAVPVAQSLGTRQCESGGRTLQALAQSLRDAGVNVLAQACGHDGRMRPAVCGAPDGMLGIIEIPADQLAKARSMGFVTLASLPDARRQDCPPPR